MKKTIDLGKIDYNQSGRKNCRVTVDIEIRDDGELSICGNIWNPRGTDCYSCGQNLDEIGKLFPSSEKVQRIVAIWKRWHLNNMKAGSPRQESHLREHPLSYEYPTTHFDEALKVLGAVGLNPDMKYMRDGKPYQYGSAWLKEELPSEVKLVIETI